MKNSVIIALAALGFAPAALATTAPQGHVYNLTQSLADTHGGPSLVADGGTQTASGYAFGPDQGLTLTGALSSLSDYSIEFTVSLAANNGTRGNGYQKLIDFQDKASDSGLYDLNGALNFYQPATGPLGAFTPGVTEDVKLTRDSATDLVTGSVNGVQQFQFTDTSGIAVFGSNTIHFFEDDNVTGQGEAGSGVVKSIGVNSAPVPEASTVISFGVLLALGAWALKAKKRTA